MLLWESIWNYQFSSVQKIDETSEIEARYVHKSKWQLCHCNLSCISTLNPAYSPAHLTSKKVQNMWRGTKKDYVRWEKASVWQQSSCMRPFILGERTARGLRQGCVTEPRMELEKEWRRNDCVLQQEPRSEQKSLGNRFETNQVCFVTSCILSYAIPCQTQEV